MVKRKAKAKDRNRPLRGGPSAVAGRLLRLFLLGGALFLFFHLTAGEPTLRIGFAALLTALALHEGGHLFMMLCSGALGRKARCGARAYPWGVELRTARGYRSYGEQVLVSLGGVGVNFLTAALLFAGRAETPAAEGGLSLFLTALAGYSLLLGCLHLLPVDGLDGGSALEGALLALTDLSPDSVARLLLLLSVLLLIPLWLLSLCVLIASDGNPSFFALCVSLFLELYRKQTG